MAHKKQSRPDHGLGFQVKVRETLEVAPSSLRSGLPCSKGAWHVNTLLERGPKPPRRRPPISVPPTPPFIGFREPRNLCGGVFRRAACSPGLGFRGSVYGAGIWVLGSGFRIQGLGSRVWD